MTTPIHPELKKALTAVRPRSDKAILTAKMEQEYSRDASQKRQAKATVLAWGKASKKKKADAAKG